MKSLLWLRWTSAAIFTAAIFLGSPHSRGAVFSRDWKTPGDGLLTYDDVNRREWLDLSQTSLSVLPGNNFAAKLTFLKSNLTAGGAYSGFQFASSSDFLAMASSSGIDRSLPLFDAAPNIPSALRLIELLSPSYSFPGENSSRGAVGFFDEFRPRQFTLSPLLRVGGVVIVVYVGRPYGAAYDTIALDDADVFGTSDPGFYLHRSVIPEPSASRLCVLGCVILLNRIHRSHRRLVIA